MNDFNSRFNAMQRRHDTMSKFVWGFIAVVFALIFAWWIFVGYVAVNAADEVSEVGIKGAIEKLWCGKQPNCKLPGN